jgi:uncharacterized membrane protein HdeD (DUF308 family)
MDKSQTPGTDPNLGAKQRIASRIVLGRVAAIQPDSRRQQRLAGAVVLGMGVLALFVPLWPELAPERRLGLTLLAISGIMTMAYRADARQRRLVRRPHFARSAILLLNASMLISALRYFVVGWFVVDGIRYAMEAMRAGDHEPVGKLPLGYFVLILLVLLVETTACGRWRSGARAVVIPPRYFQPRSQAMMPGAHAPGIDTPEVRAIEHWRGRKCRLTGTGF